MTSATGIRDYIGYIRGGYPDLVPAQEGPMMFARDEPKMRQIGVMEGSWAAGAASTVA